MSAEDFGRSWEKWHTVNRHCFVFQFRQAYELFRSEEALARANAIIPSTILGVDEKTFTPYTYKEFEFCFNIEDVLTIAHTLKAPNLPRHTINQRVACSHRQLLNLRPHADDDVNQAPVIDLGETNTDFNFP